MEGNWASQRKSKLKIFFGNFWLKMLAALCRDEKNATGAFFGQLPGAGDGILTTLPLRSHLHGGS
jgi:hypothetical protein